MRERVKGGEARFGAGTARQISISRHSPSPSPHTRTMRPRAALSLARGKLPIRAFQRARLWAALRSVRCRPNSETRQPNRPLPSRAGLVGLDAGNQTRP